MYQPFEIGRRFRILPPDAPASGDGRLDLIIAKGAFGSGEHETTASCLKALEDLSELQGARILDLGCGTGILALAALRLGAATALCLDINPDAVATARRNAELNGLAERTEFITGVLDDVAEQGFDLILANIYSDLLLDLAPALVSRARPGAILLLSGLLWGYNYDVRTTYEQLGCTVLKNRMLDEFSTILLRKEACAK